MRPRIVLALIAATLSVSIAACGGGGSEEPTPVEVTGTPTIPTATPFAQLPAPVIVTATAGEVSGEDLTYIVEPGDSLSAIAQRFDTTTEAIMERNGLPDVDIIVGQELIIPGAPPSSGGDTTTAPTATPTPASGVYVVEAGDTALGIALRFGTTLEELAAANGMTEDEISHLRIGQEIQLPAAR